MRVRYTPNARDCLVEIREYISRSNPQAARRVITTIRQQILSLINHPDLGRLGRCEASRELLVTPYPYIVAYRIETDEIQILAVVHTSRSWPEKF